MKIRMVKTVRPDIPFLAKPGTILHNGEIYEASTNKHGAISGICPNGEELGVKPGEFIFIGAPKWVIDIWADVCPFAITKETTVTEI